MQLAVDIKMRLVKYDVKLPVENINVNLNIKPFIKHSLLLPNNVRSILVGPSNCGKTNSLLLLLTSENGIKFQNLYVFSKTLEQPKYKYLDEIMKRCQCVGYQTFPETNAVIPLEEAANDSAIVFDDIAGEKQEAIERYFSRGRHKNIDCFYLCQTYTRIPKQLIRDNANFLLIFEQDTHNLKFIYDEHVNTDMPFKKLVEVCKMCWDVKLFLCINRECALNAGRYRRAFDEFILI